MQNIQTGYMMLIHVEKVLSLDYQSSECSRPKGFMRKDILIIEILKRVEELNFSFILILNIFIAAA